MGRPTSCFKIITCAGESDNEENHAVSESKCSNDKRGWSFRKKSARHRLLSNTVITETPSSATKESPESVLKDTNEKTQLSTFLDTKASEPMLDANAVDPKASKPVVDANEADAKVSEAVLDPNYVDARVSETVLDATSVDAKESEAMLDVSSVDTKVSETLHATQNKTVDTVDLKESFVIVIQTAIRGFLAKKELVKRKNVVKLQAAVRGHLVRQHALGTLRCVQAVIKMQALVRSRRARIGPKELYAENQSGGKYEKDGRQVTTPGKDVLSNESNVKSTSVQKLLSNRFARQLLESTPKNKSINIKCDSSKPNSAWKWLERWMSLSSAGPSSETELMTQQQKGENNDNYISQIDVKAPSEALYESNEVSSDVEDTTGKSEEKLVTTDAQNHSYDINSLGSVSLKEDLKQPEFENKSASSTNEISEVIDSVSNHILSLNASSQPDINSIPSYSELGSDQQPKRSMKRNASEELQTEGKKFVYGSRKASNPAFIAAHSKFEELASSTKSGQSNGSSSRADGTESNLDTISLGADYCESKVLELADNSVSNVSVIQIGGSECGTEISISSTLDSPDRSEIEVIERDSEDKPPEEVFHNTDLLENPDVEDQISLAVPVSNSSQAVSNQQKLDYGNGETSDSAVRKNSHEQKQQPEIINLDQSVVTEDSHVPEEKPGKVNLDQSVVIDESHVPEKKPEKNSLDQSGVADDYHEPKQKTEISNLDLQKKMYSETSNQAYRSTPEASPRTSVTVSESQRTPSRQTSVKPKRDGSDKRGSSNKRKSLSTSKASPLIPTPSSGRKGSVEQSSKEQEAVRRRSSFGSTKPEDIDHEPIDCSSAVPRFMQATESARAKLHASNSPRSSPDVNERETYIKKRHSLPGATGRQGSPHIQRSTSQPQQGAKGNSSRSPQERKWQR